MGKQERINELEQLQKELSEKQQERQKEAKELKAKLEQLQNDFQNDHLRLVAAQSELNGLNFED